jgi:hypothetical protein
VSAAAAAAPAAHLRRLADGLAAAIRRLLVALGGRCVGAPTPDAPATPAPTDDGLGPLLGESAVPAGAPMAAEGRGTALGAWGVWEATWDAILALGAQSMVLELGAQRSPLPGLRPRSPAAPLPPGAPAPSQQQQPPPPHSAPLTPRPPPLELGLAEEEEGGGAEQQPQGGFFRSLFSVFTSPSEDA